MEKEAKKETFRKYLESSGALDALTKVLVALYEQNDKPSSAMEFIQQKLGGPSLTDYEKLQAEKSDLQIKYNELLALHHEKCTEFEELKNSHVVESSKETLDVESRRDVKDYSLTIKSLLAKPPPKQTTRNFLSNERRQFLPSDLTGRDILMDIVGRLPVGALIILSYECKS